MGRLLLRARSRRILQRLLRRQHGRRAIVEVERRARRALSAVRHVSRARRHWGEILFMRRIAWVGQGGSRGSYNTVRKPSSSNTCACGGTILHSCALSIPPNVFLALSSTGPHSPVRPISSIINKSLGICLTETKASWFPPCLSTSFCCII